MNEPEHMKEDQATYASLSTAASPDQENFDAIIQFAEVLNRNSHGLELDIADALNRDFWDLV